MIRLEGWARPQTADFVHQIQEDGKKFKELTKTNPEWRKLKVESLITKEKQAQYHHPTPQAAKSRKFDFEASKGQRKVVGLIVGALLQQKAEDQYARYVKTKPEESAFTKSTNEELFAAYAHFVERFAQLVHFSNIPSQICKEIKDAVYLNTGAKSVDAPIGSHKYFLQLEYSEEDAQYLEVAYQDAYAAKQQEAYQKAGGFQPKLKLNTRPIINGVKDSFKDAQLVSKISKRVDERLVVKINVFYGRIHDHFFKSFVTQIQPAAVSPTQKQSPKKRSPKEALVEKRSPHTPKSVRPRRSPLFVATSPLNLSSRLSIIDVIPRTLSLSPEHKSPGKSPEKNFGSLKFKASP